MTRVRAVTLAANVLAPASFIAIGFAVQPWWLSLLAGLPMLAALIFAYVDGINVGRAGQRAVTVATIGPHGLYRLVGPDGIWVVAGLETTDTSEATLVLVEESEWERRRDRNV